MNVFYNHLHFRSGDPDGAAKFYCDNFGAEIVAERPLSNTKSIELSLNGTYLMTISGRAEGEDPVAGSTEPRYGLDHLGFQTDNIMELAATLKSNNVHFNCEPWGDALGLRGGLHRRPRRSQRRDHPASRCRRGARRPGGLELRL